MGKMKTISQKELKHLEKEGHVTQRSRQVKPVSAPVVPLNPPSDEQVLKAAQAAQSAAESMQALAMQSTTANADQIIMMQKTMQQISDSLVAMAVQPQWTEIDLAIDRDRNDYIKSARITRVK